MKEYHDDEHGMTWNFFEEFWEEYTMIKMDKKFTGVIYKVKDGSIVPDDEWICFLVKDDAFAATLPTYLAKCIVLGADDVQIRLVEEMIDRVDEWRKNNPNRLKVPDADGEIILP
jgi:hypothetical protein